MKKGYLLKSCLDGYLKEGRENFTPDRDRASRFRREVDVDAFIVETWGRNGLRFFSAEHI